MSLALEAILGTGPPLTSPAAAGAAETLRTIATGPFRAGQCAPPPTDDGVRWCAITSVPAAGDDAGGPLARVLTSLGGSRAQLRVRIRHDDAAGTGLYLGSADAALVGRVHRMLAPAYDCDLSTTTPGLVPPVLTGVAYRLQADLAGDVSRSSAWTGLLDLLTSVPGRWSAELLLTSTPQAELHAVSVHLDQLADFAAEHTTTTRQRSGTQSSTVVSAGWSRVQQWASVLQAHVTHAGTCGAWRVATWATAADAATVDQVLAALHGALPPREGRQFVARDLDLTDGAPPPVSLLSSRDLAALLASPAYGSPGLAVRKTPPAHRRPDTSSEQLHLGSYWSTDVPAAIGLDDLEGHAFITGTTGSGKTTTLHRLLAEVWNRHRRPFLVLDPVKDEYSNVAGLFRGGLNVLTGSELSLNLLQAWPGEDSRTHVAQVAQAFRGAFTMPSPTPYVVTQLFDAVAMQPGGPDGSELHDVRDLLDPLVTSLGYAPEAQSNIRAALGTRLNILLSPARAHRFAWSGSDMVNGLFDRPSVVTLADVVDEEERSFLVLLLALATWARARARKAPKAVEHLLVLEEAHRVLPEVGPSVADPESGSAQRVSATLLAAMLAEVRSFGEQVVVVDQSPSKVAGDVIRNTNLKITHRVVHPEDQAQVAGAIGLAAKDADLLGALARGQVIVSTRREPAPQTLRVGPITRNQTGARALPVARPQPGWPCCTDRPEGHFRAWQAAAHAEGAMALFLVACRVGGGHGVRALVHDQVNRVAQPLQTRSDCLAWAGLRRLLVRERREALLADHHAVQRSLHALFELWAARIAPSPVSAGDFQVPGVGMRRTCLECGATCNVRVPAWALYLDGPRTGLQALASPRWRDELAEVGNWLKAERIRLTRLLGPEGAVTTLRCQVHQAVRRNGLASELAGNLTARAGLT